MEIINIIKRIRYILLLFLDNLKFGRKKREETFDYIYARNCWGRIDGVKYYSGSGSYKLNYVEPYCQLIKKFISEHNIVNVVDLGCGDFNVASSFISENISYEGIDIVQEMIEDHNKKYGSDNVHFQCLDIVEDSLPDGELCLIRQVLQHLSNDEVISILNKVTKYKYVIITEHITKKEYASKYNVDKSHGSYTRVYAQSGLYFDEHPFNLEIETLMKIPYYKKNKEELISILIKNI